MIKKKSKGLPDHINLSDYDYDLPSDLIAEWPLKNRSKARLLVYDQGKIAHSHFEKLDAHLPENSLLVYNDTKVVKARLFFKTKSGASVEIFCVSPAKPVKEQALAMHQSSPVVWKCMIGNKKKWKTDQKLEIISIYSDTKIKLKATYKGISDNTGIHLVQFEWTPVKLTFSRLLEIYGKMPLPPYIKREATEVDNSTYQTIYAGHEGAVAAPTAGLHFDKKMLKKLQNSGIKSMFITLHVGAGTFLPVKTENVIQHNMHAERIIFTKENIEYLLTHSECIIAVGTTSLRALESLYWIGYKLFSTEKKLNFDIDQYFPYQYIDKKLPDKKVILKGILDFMKKNKLNKLEAETSIFILPPYQLKMCKGLITNFHLPCSTLLMLIAAITGDDWKIIYSEAVHQKYRFLSYGDSSLLI